MWRAKCAAWVLSVECVNLWVVACERWMFASAADPLYLGEYSSKCRSMFRLDVKCVECQVCVYQSCATGCGKWNEANSMTRSLFGVRQRTTGYFVQLAWRCWKKGEERKREREREKGEAKCPIKHQASSINDVSGRWGERSVCLVDLTTHFMPSIGLGVSSGKGEKKPNLTWAYAYISDDRV